MSSPDPYAAALESAVIFDRSSSRGRIEIAGSDRRVFLHALLTNDIAKLTTGTGTYAAYLTQQGRMISDMRVFEIGDRMLLGVEGPVAPGLVERLDTLIFSEDVRVRDVSGALDEIGVHGPSAQDIIERATEASIADLLHEYDNLTAGSLIIARDADLGVPGYVIFVPRLERQSLWSRLIEGGAIEAGVETSEALRLEAGRPRFGVDMGTDTIPLEAGIEGRAISLTKGCYVGQEVIVRVLHRGHGRVARRLVRLVTRDKVHLSPGDKIFVGDREVGQITSAAESPRAGASIAFAYIQRDQSSPGTEVTVNGSQARVDQPLD